MPKFFKIGFLIYGAVVLCVAIAVWIRGAPLLVPSERGYQGFLKRGNEPVAIDQVQIAERPSETPQARSDPASARAIAELKQAAERSAGRENHQRPGRGIQTKSLISRYNIETEILYTKLLTLQEKALGSNDLELTETLLALARLYELADRKQDAAQASRRALSVVQKQKFLVGSANSADSAPALQRALAVLNELLRLFSFGYKDELYSDAETTYKLMAVIQKKLGQGFEDGLASTYEGLGELYIGHNRVLDGETSYKEAIEIRQRILDRASRAGTTTASDYGTLSRALVSLGQSLNNRGNFNGAIGVAQRNVDITTQGLRAGKLTPLDMSEALLHLAESYDKGGKDDNAEVTYVSAVSAVERNTPRASPTQAPRIIGGLDEETAEALQDRLTSLAQFYDSRRRFGNVEQVLGRILELQEKTKRYDDNYVLDGIVKHLLTFYSYLGREDDLRRVKQRLLVIAQTELDNKFIQLENVSKDSDESSLQLARKQVGESMDKLIQLLQDLRYSRQVVSYLERRERFAREFESSDGAVLFKVLCRQSYVYADLGKPDRAEAARTRAIAAYEQMADQSSFAEIDNLGLSGISDLALLYNAAGRLGDLEMPLKRVLATKKVAGLEQIKLLRILAEIYEQEGRNSDQEDTLLRIAELSQSLSQIDKRTPPIFEGISRIRLLQLYRSLNRTSDADRAFLRLRQIDQQLSTGLEKTPHNIDYQMVRGLVFQSEGQFAEAAISFKKVLDFKEKTFGKDHPDFAAALDEVATSYANIGDFDNALSYSRRSVEAAIASDRAFSSSRAPLANIVGGSNSTASSERGSTKFEYKKILDRYIGSLGGQGVVEVQTPRSRDFFDHHLRNLAGAMRNHPDRSALAQEAFEVGQYSSFASAAVAIAQMASRLAASSPETAADLRKQQDLAAQWRDLDDLLAKATQRPPGEWDQSKIEKIRGQLADTQISLTEISQRISDALEKKLNDPRSLSASGVQRFLASDESMAFFAVGDAETHIFVLNSDELHFRTIPITRNELEQEVVNFRAGLDVEEFYEAQERGKPVFFNLDQSLRLYKLLLQPDEPVFRSKKNLIVVPSGPLASLPFHLLVTDAAVEQPRSAREIQRFKDAAWLLKRHAISILPSVGNLKALRGLAQQNSARRTLIGFGDPIFKIADTVRAGQPTRQSNQKGSAPRGKEAPNQLDREQLRNLPELNETADELLTVARSLSVPREDIHLRADARESLVKSAPLADYRIIYFATHTIFAHMVKGVDEPSLALTFPRRPDAMDDGLLMASEIAQLKLNADWVILSACNTAGGEQPSDALTGLVRAFFYAGARALLVTHWRIGSRETPQLMISMFDALRKDEMIGRSEALRRAMISYMNDRTNPDNANPAFWGAFIVVGEGSRR